MGKQLNIRNDEAFELAHKLAMREQTTVAAVVVDALRQKMIEFEAKQDIFNEKAVTDRKKAFEEMRARFAHDIPVGTSSDHSYLYDENGLPV